MKRLTCVHVEISVDAHRLVVIPDAGRRGSRARGLGVLADIDEPLLIGHRTGAVERVVGGRVLQRRKVVGETRRRICETARRLLQLRHYTLSNRLGAIAFHWCGEYDTQECERNRRAQNKLHSCALWV